MYFKHFIYLTILLTTLSTAYVNAGGPVLPEQWRLPSKNETLHESHSSHTISIAGDFNGDSLVDGAVIAVTADNKYQELLAFIYDSQLKEHWQVLDTLPFSGKITMELATIAAGKSKFICTTKETCTKENRKEIIIKNDSIFYYSEEAPKSIFVFENKSFRQLWQLN